MKLDLDETEAFIMIGTSPHYGKFKFSSMNEEEVRILIEYADVDKKISEMDLSEFHPITNE